VQLLIKEGADLKSKDDRGKTPWELAEEVKAEKVEPLRSAVATALIPLLKGDEASKKSGRAANRPSVRRTKSDISIRGSQFRKRKPARSSIHASQG